MKVFLSWSGERSKAVAELLDEWIQCVLQAVHPWMSARDIDRGSLWFTEISDQLSDVTTGIVFLTKENKDRPWILFEAGAMARGLSSQRVMTLLIDLTPNDILDPLAQFNHTLPDKSGLRSLTSSINARLGERAVSPKTLDSVFETYWPQFESRFSQILSTYPERTVLPERSEESKVDELLSHVRSMDRRMRELEKGVLAPATHSPAKTNLDGWSYVPLSKTKNEEERRMRNDAMHAANELRESSFTPNRFASICKKYDIPQEYLKEVLCGMHNEER